LVDVIVDQHRIEDDPYYVVAIMLSTAQHLCDAFGLDEQYAFDYGDRMYNEDLEDNKVMLSLIGPLLKRRKDLKLLKGKKSKVPAQLKHCVACARPLP
jgi:hypothetical protein